MRTSLFHRVEPRHGTGSPRALPRLRRGSIGVREESGKPASAREQSEPAAGPAGDPGATGPAGDPGATGLAGNANAAVTHAHAAGADAAVGRAQAAGGPVDEATYECCCGLLFSAPVSTTVCCPHCGAEQAW